jgi:mono/diheme cytochrome c family protein
MKFLAGVLVALLVVGGAALLVVYTGLYNVAATEPHTRLVQEILETAMTRSVRARALDITVPGDLADPTRVRQGASEYEEMCVLCHGGPGGTLSPIGKGLNPAPPLLHERALERSRAELFWIIAHGVKMTGMPAFGPSHDDSEIWAVVAFLERLPSLSFEQYAGLIQQDTSEEVRHEEHEHPPQ